ncbi:MAG TPA: alkaline phosphatase family protein [Acidobacteriota bacterium]|nr:alkaline phosphatase family protein [Acidobacteriota bacterium]
MDQPRIIQYSRPAPWSGVERIAPGKRSAARGWESRDYGALKGRQKWFRHQVICRPCRGFSGLKRLTPGCASLAWGYSLAPLRGASTSHPICWWYLTLVALALLLSFPSPVEAYVGPGAGFAFLSSFLVLIGVFFLAVLSLLTWPFRLLYWLVKGRAIYGRSKINKLVIVGLDGMDPALAERFMADGKLPNFSQLKDEGSYAPLRTTVPSISPVAWSSFMTGTNPSKHNIFDFLSRDPRNYLPALSSAYIGKPRKMLSLGGFRIPVSKPEIRGMRKSVPFWKILGNHGIFSTILRVPITFPPEKFKGHLLSGMCVPDLKGSQGTFSFYTSNHEKAKAMEGGQSIPVDIAGNRIHTYVSGPANTLREKAEELRLGLTIDLLPDGETVDIHVDDQQFRLKKGKFSPWIRLTFKPGLGFRVRCICRFLVSAIRPEFEMYLTPLNIDPEKPALPISHPFYYSIYLSKLLGRFVTLGLANDTWALNEGALTEQAFLELAYSHHEEWEKIFFNALSKTKRGVVACVFETTDSIQHMFFRYLNRDHPALKTGNSRMGEHVIEDLYRRMDEMIGRIRERLDGGSALIVMSDHGFKSFSRGVNLNSWLLDNGYLVLKNGKTKSREWLDGVDWTNTKAYALGLGGIYLNLKGREACGIVGPGDEARGLKQELVGKLTGLIDDDKGMRAINAMYDSEEIFKGPYRENSPDLIVGYSEGYRASWESVKGVVTSVVFEDNTKAWSGDHCIDPAVVPGVIFCSKKLDANSPSIWDIAPTALDLFGVPIPAHMDGRSLVDAAKVPPIRAEGRQ